MTQTLTQPRQVSSAATRPRVLHCITHLGLGGAERACFTIMRGLLNEYDFHVFAVTGVEDSAIGKQFFEELREMNILLHTGTKVPIKFGGMALGGWALRNVVKKIKPDIIQLHTEIPEASYAAMVAMSPSLGKIPIVRTIQNSVLWTPWRKLGRWCENHMKDSHIAAVSNSAMDAYRAFREDAKAGALPSVPKLIFNTVSVPPPDTNREFKGDRPVKILFAGRFEDQKGVDLLPTVLQQIKLPQGTTVDLTLHGHGTYESLLNEMASKPPAGWTITVKGPVPNLTQLIRSYDLLIMPSRFEGLSLVAMESVLQGVPIVGTSAPGMTDVFPTDYPWLAVPGDANAYATLLQRVLESPETWTTVSRDARAFALERFDVKAMCNSYRELYTEVLASSSTNRP